MEKSIFYSDNEENFFARIRQCVTSVIKQELASAGQKENSPEEFISMEEVAKLLKVSKPTVYKHIECGYYRRKNIGRKVLFSRQEVLSFIQKGGSK